MALEEHTIREPSWIKALVYDVIVDAVQPLGFIGPLGYYWWQPGNDHNVFDGWQVVVFPAPYEIRGTSPHDGNKSVSGFRLNFSSILEVLSSVESVVWHSPVRYNGDLDGPELSVQGQFAGKRVWLRFFNLPPPDEPCSHYVDPTTGEAREKPAC
jgi:hypothetical protein